MSYPRLAVLGLSHGYKFVKRLMYCNFARLVAVADLNIETALKSYSVDESEVSEKSKLLNSDIKLFKEYKDLLKDMSGEIDGVIAALPNDLHVEVTKEAAKFGINLMLEKPIASTIPEGKEIVEIIDHSKIKFIVAHHRRFSKLIQRAKEAVQQGELGEVIGANILWVAKKPDDYFKQAWRIDKTYGGPLLINTIHDIDDLRYIIGDIEEVQAFITNKFRGNEVEDSGAMNVRFKNGALATIFLTDNCPSPWFYEACTQEYSFFYPSYYDCYFFFGKKASLAFPSLTLFSYEKEFGEGWHRPLKKQTLLAERFDVLEEELKHFYELIEGKVESKITASDALETLRVIDALKRSSKSGESISL
ncbi:MAG: Gfo/Idh/MocA family oxidoreductase [Candidatus Atribacteria bacterium]|nr:Gfo/Idh/MocA family oxidoreductase [Candidatus Atribacteria bacterium]